jgi:4,5-DOPA dioxygenase extradiol
MQRRSFLTSLALGTSTIMTTAKSVVNELASGKSTPRMPVLFIGHGTPMNAIEKNSYSETWKKIGSSLPTPRAILCVSAHWETNGTMVTAMARPKTIHDFGGFPQTLFDVQYPAPGSPELASDLVSSMKTHVELDHAWGLDHGAWSVLNQMYPDATIPTLQLSLDATAEPLTHLEIARELAFLRDKGVLIIGSGNIVHNLRRARPDVAPYDWALEFDATCKKLIQEKRLKELAEYQKLGAAALLSVPTNEHYLPMLYSAALRDRSDELTFFNENIDLAAASMTSFILA